MSSDNGSAPKPLRWLTEFLAHRPQGDRNYVLLWATMKALEDGHDREEVVPAMYHAARESGLEDRESKRTIRSALDRFDAKQPPDEPYTDTDEPTLDYSKHRLAPEWDWITARIKEGIPYAQAQTEWDHAHSDEPAWDWATEDYPEPEETLYDRAAKLLPPPPPEGSEFERAWQGLSHEILRGEWKRSRDLSTIAESQTPPFITLGQTRDMETTDEDSVIADGILTRGGKLLAYAYAGAGKTTLLDTLAASLASGKPFLNVHAIDRPHRVLFVQAELTASEIASHGQDLLEVFEGSQAETNLCFWRNTQLPLPAAEQRLRDAITATTASILILDPFNRFFRGESSTTPEQVGELFRMIDRLLEDEALGLEGAVLSHHMNVSRARMAGTYDFEGWPSTILRLEVISPLMTTRKLTFEKLRAPRSTLLGSTKIIDLTSHGYVYAGDSEPTVPFAGPFLVAKALAELGGQAYRQELIDRTRAIANVSARTASTYISNAVSQKLIERLPDLAPNKQRVFRLLETPATEEDA